MLIHAFHAAFEDREETLNGIGSDDELCTVLILIANVLIRRCALQCRAWQTAIPILGEVPFIGNKSAS